jgi:hypothetical protein
MDGDREALEAVAKSLAYCEWTGAELSSGGIAVRADLREISDGMIALRKKIHGWLRERPRCTAKDSMGWWSAFCDECGWAGLSRDCEGGWPIADTGDHEDPRCPVCLTVLDEDKRA